MGGEGGKGGGEGGRDKEVTKSMLVYGTHSCHSTLHYTTLNQLQAKHSAESLPVFTHGHQFNPPPGALTEIHLELQARLDNWNLTTLQL